MPPAFFRSLKIESIYGVANTIIVQDAKQKEKTLHGFLPCAELRLFDMTLSAVKVKQRITWRPQQRFAFAQARIEVMMSPIALAN